jgi:hypothetical protein
MRKPQILRASGGGRAAVDSVLRAATGKMVGTNIDELARHRLTYARLVEI